MPIPQTRFRFVLAHYLGVRWLSVRSVNRRRFVHQSRRGLSWCLAFTALLQLGLAVAIPYGLPELRDPYYVFKRQRLESLLERHGSDGPVVVMLGSSRTSFGLRAGDLSQQLSTELGRPAVAFNFGIPGAGPVMNLLHLRRLLADGIRPDLLLVEVLPPLFSCRNGPTAERNWLPANRLWCDELDLLEQQGIPMTEQRRDWWQELPLPWHSQRFAIMSTVAPGWLPSNLRQDWAKGNDPWGWSANLIPDHTPEDHRRAVEWARREYANYLDSFILRPAPCTAQRELLRLCRQHGIPVALVLMPEGPTFRSWYSPTARWRIQKQLQQIVREFDVPLINARTWLEEEDFSDSHHLRLAGAKRYTEQLGREILARFLQSGPPGCIAVAQEESPCATGGN